MKNTSYLSAFCATAVFAGFLSACSMVEACTTAECAADAKITAEVRRAIDERPAFSSARIYVETIHGVVYLHGLVDTSYEVNKVGELAQVPGVVEVYNDVTTGGS